MCEENEREAHSEKNARCRYTREGRRGRPNLRGKNHPRERCVREIMTEAGQKDDKATLIDLIERLNDRFD